MIKHTHELLNQFCLDKNIRLTKDYSEEKMTRKTKIEGECVNAECSNTFNKLF